MPTRIPLVAVLVLVVGLLLILNGQWLFPNEGDQLYQYERTAVTIENETLTYESPMRRPQPGALHAVDCQNIDRFDRSCGLDRYLVANGNLTIAAGDSRQFRAADQQYTRIDGTYYRRTVVTNETHATYGLERVAARELRASLANEVPVLDDDSDVPSFSPVGFEATLTGEPVVSTDPPGTLRLGRVYVQNGSYYTVVQTDEMERDRPLVSSGTRTLLSIVGVFVLMLGAVLAAPDDSGTRRGGE